MSDALRIGWTEADVARRRRAYRLVLGAVLLLHAAIALVALFCPLVLVTQAVVPSHVVTDWVRIGGLLLLALTLFYAAGWLDPLVSRGPNVIGVAALAGAGVLLLVLGGRFLGYGLAELLLAGLLGVLYWRLMRSKLMSLPG